jgi:hypothetical protein
MMYACALLHFNFYYSNFGRWLGDKYTNRHRDWAKTVLIALMAQMALILAAQPTHLSRAQRKVTAMPAHQFTTPQLS